MGGSGGYDDPFRPLGGLSHRADQELPPMELVMTRLTNNHEVACLVHVSSIRKKARGRVGSGSVLDMMNFQIRANGMVTAFALPSDNGGVPGRTLGGLLRSRANDTVACGQCGFNKRKGECHCPCDFNSIDTGSLSLPKGAMINELLGDRVILYMKVLYRHMTLLGIYHLREIMEVSGHDKFGSTLG